MHGIMPSTANQLNSTAAKLRMSELLQIAPSVHAEAQSMLEQLDAEQNAQRANATFAAMESQMPMMSCIAPEDIYEYAKQPPIAYKHIQTLIKVLTTLMPGTESARLS